MSGREEIGEFGVVVKRSIMYPSTTSKKIGRV